MIKNYFKTPLALIALMSVTATGCFSIIASESSKSNNTSKVQKVQKENISHTLQGEWLITKANDVKTAKYEGDASLTFSADGRANGRAVVNGFFGDYVFDGKNILFGRVGATKMMGPEEEMKAESAILQAINDAKSATVDADKATIYDSKGKVVMTLEKK